MQIPGEICGINFGSFGLMIQVAGEDGLVGNFPPTFFKVDWNSDKSFYELGVVIGSKVSVILDDDNYIVEIRIEKVPSKASVIFKMLEPPLAVITVLLLLIFGVFFLKNWLPYIISTLLALLIGLIGVVAWIEIRKIFNKPKKGE